MNTNSTVFRLPDDWPADWNTRYTLFNRGMGPLDPDGSLPLESLPFVGGDGLLLWYVPELGYATGDADMCGWRIGEWCAVALMCHFARDFAGEEDYQGRLQYLTECVAVDFKFVIDDIFLRQSDDRSRSGIFDGFVACLGYYLGALVTHGYRVRPALEALTPEKWNQGLQRILDGENLPLPGVNV